MNLKYNVIIRLHKEDKNEFDADNKNCYLSDDGNKTHNIMKARKFNNCQEAQDYCENNNLNDYNWQEMWTNENGDWTTEDGDVIFQKNFLNDDDFWKEK